MNKLFYPAIFHKAEEGGFWVSLPDFPECFTDGDSMEHLVRFKAPIRWGYHNDMAGDISFLDKLEPFKYTPHREKFRISTWRPMNCRPC